MRRALHILICLLALLAMGCSSKKDAVTRLEGSEPQRLSFGAPQDVQQAFANQMQSCWFSGPSAPLAGYTFDSNPAQFQTSSGTGTLNQVTIRDDDNESQFVIQFFPFNNNTLISTRNLSMPLELAGRLKRDIETWIFGGKDCGDRARLVNETPSAGPQISATQVQQPPASGWETSPADAGANSNSIY